MRFSKGDNFSKSGTTGTVFMRKTVIPAITFEALGKSTTVDVIYPELAQMYKPHGDVQDDLSTVDSELKRLIPVALTLYKADDPEDPFRLKFVPRVQELFSSHWPSHLRISFQVFAATITKDSS